MHVVNYIQKVRKDSYEFVLQSDDCGGYGHDFGVDFVDLMEALSEINKDSIKKIWLERKSIYRDCADIIINTDNKSIDKVSDEILQSLSL